MNAWSLVLVAAICLVSTAEPTEAGCRRCCRILCHCGQQKATTDGGSSEASQPKASASNVPGAGQSPQPIMTSGTGSDVSTSSTGLDAIDNRLKRIEKMLNIKPQTEADTNDQEAAVVGIILERLAGRIFDRVDSKLDRLINDSLDEVLPPVEPPPVNVPNGGDMAIAFKQAATDAIHSADIPGMIKSAVEKSYQSNEFKSAIKESYQSDDFKNAVKAVIAK